MDSVWKFVLPLEDKFSLLMPERGEIVALQIQRGEPCIWACVDTTAEMVRRNFITVGTGHEVPDVASTYIGTYQLAGGDFVFHVFEVL